MRNLFIRTPEPMRDGGGADDPGPHNLSRDRENPDVLRPPKTDHGAIPNLKFSFNMRLKPLAFRELHWHKQAEWSYMLVGRARVTAIDEDGHNSVDDLDVGDLWYFPPGIPHSIQALEEGCEFLLVFNDGNFSESSTFLVSEWFAHVPKDVLAANFGVDKNQFANTPKSELYIFQAKIPGPIETQRVQSPQGTVPPSFSYRLHKQEPLQSSGGTVRIADSRNFVASEKIAAALVDIKPGGMRELHWHPNAAEWQYYIEGQARMRCLHPKAKRELLTSRPATSGTCPLQWDITFRMLEKARCVFWRYLRAIDLPTYRFGSGWR
jgi:oxalate decarboxylase